MDGKIMYRQNNGITAWCELDQREWKKHLCVKYRLFLEYSKWTSKEQIEKGNKTVRRVAWQFVDLEYLNGISII